MATIDDVLTAVRARAAYPVDDREAESIAQFLTLAPSLARPYDEHADPVHITGSAFIVGERGIVLLKHRKLGIWVQPGGHIDPGETPADAALREAREETGMDCTLVSDDVVHVDVHPGPRGHTHLDLRYLMHASADDPTPPPDESQDCYWFSWPDALARAEPTLAGILTSLSDAFDPEAKRVAGAARTEHIEP